MRKFPVWLVLWVLLFSCTKEIHIPIPPVESRPVVNCFFTPDSIFTMYVGKPVPVFDNQPRVLDNAKIRLYENHIYKDSFAFSSGLYHSSFVPEAGKYYRIIVNVPGYDTVFAGDKIPAYPHEISGSYKDSVMFDEDGYPVSQVKLNIDDDPDEKNYYEVLLEMYDKIPDDTLWHTLGRIWYYEKNSDPVLENEGLIPFEPLTLVFSDELFNGRQYTLTVNYQRSVYNYGNYQYIMVVFFRAVTEEYYRYKKQLIKHLYNQQSDIWNGMGNPVQMYSNIQGGYGIFAGYAEIRDTLTKDKK